MSKRGWVLFLALGVIWGVPYAMIRIAVESIDPVVVAFGRTAIGGLILLPIALYTNAFRGVAARWRMLLAYTAIEIVGPWVLLGYAEQTLHSSTVGLLVAAVPLIAIVIVTLLGHDRFDGRRTIGLLIGFAGVAALVGLDLDLTDPAALAAVAVTTVGYAIGPIIYDRTLADLPALGVVTASLLLAALVYTPFTAVSWPAHIPADAAWSVLGLAVICTATAFLVFFALIAEVGPARATVITYVNPAVAIVLGVAALGEPLTIGMAIGFPLVVIGSIIGTRSATRVQDRLPAPADSC
ncbi:DMT family transporter [Nocardia sp. NPDC060259]|uniref:DMT family transporter n=1 Tax=Nocardia sp. NPDC060259 TaxID=3347088 RepID=UPI00364FEA75